MFCCNKSGMTLLYCIWLFVVFKAILHSKWSCM